MIPNRKLFLDYLAQTSQAPLLIDIESAEGIYLFDTSGNKYFDLISGIAVSSTGHRHPKVIAAIEKQLTKHLHVMVYGELIQSTQIQLAAKISSLLPPALNSVYFVNSGSEAIEGAMKLSKRVSGRCEIISFRNAYHGSTHGALSICGNEGLKNSFRPLLPDIRILEFNNEEDLEHISEKTSAVILEPIQGEAGVILPNVNYLEKIRAKCTETGAHLILDEIQTGFGRTGTMFAFEQFGIIPDILCLGKAMGGGMPLGAFVSSRENMNTFTVNPVLGHITTFGGHPVSCAAALANIEVIENEKLLEQVAAKEVQFKYLLQHSSILSLRTAGLMIALEFKDRELNGKIISGCIAKGVLLDWFLFADNCMRIAPPLTISHDEISEVCGIINSCIMEFS